MPAPDRSSPDALPESQAEAELQAAPTVIETAAEAAPVAPAAPEAQAAPADPRADSQDRASQDTGLHAATPPEAESPAADRADAAHADPGMDRDAPPAQAPLPTPVLAAPALAAAVTPRAIGPSAPNRFAFAPDGLDVVAIGSTIARYVQGEGEAAWAHVRALSDARTPADLIRLQVSEVQRAADASLTCWATVIGTASRAVASR